MKSKEVIQTCTCTGENALRIAKLYDAHSNAGKRGECRLEATLALCNEVTTQWKKTITDLQLKHNCYLTYTNFRVMRGKLLFDLVEAEWQGGLTNEDNANLRDVTSV